MMHHSLFRRDLLKRMNSHPLVVARRDPHRNVARSPEAAVGEGQIALEGWRIQSARNHPAEQSLVVDATDFLTRMNTKPGDKLRILFEIGSAPAGFRIVIDDTRVEVHAADAVSLWAAWTSLEHEMRRNGGPFLTKSETTRTPKWQIQIAPPTWGTNYAVPDFSEEYLSTQTFRALAHQGADGMLIYGDFLVYAANSPFTVLDHPSAEEHLDILKDAADRAAPFGIKLYYCPVGPKLPEDHELFQHIPGARGAKLAWGTKHLHCLCSSNPQALDFHANVLGQLFHRVPNLGGLILIIGGESYYHCFMRSADSRIGETNCPNCKGKNAEDVIAKLLDVTAKSVHAQSPGAKIMAWPYSAQFFWSKDWNETDMIATLPENVGFLSEIDKDQYLQKDGYKKHIWDYTVEAEGASERITTQSKLVRARPRDMFIKCETSHGIELLHLPYVPAITRSARMWNAMRNLAPTGVLQRWGFIGMFDSAAERIDFKARWSDTFDPDAASRETARELTGSDDVVAAWKKFDQAVAHIPLMTTGQYYMGPAFLGPCHPLPVWTGDTPEPFRGNWFYLAEASATFSQEHAKAKDDFTLHTLAQLGNAVPIEIVEREFTKARDLARDGHEILQKVQPNDPEIIEQQAVGEYLYRTFEATVNTIRFLGEHEGAKDQQKLKAIAREELSNAKAAHRIYEVAPWLNHNLRLDVGVPDSLSMLEAKTQWLERFLA